MDLPHAFLARPLAHRGLHDAGAGVPENSMAAFRAAIDQRYGIECDVQLSSDGQALVFHDDDLGRLTEETGPVRARTAEELRRLKLKGAKETIPALADLLSLVQGQVPLLIEIKDQDGALGPETGLLEQAVIKALRAYEGPVAVMSFNPHAVQIVHAGLPDLPVGLVTCAFEPEEWPGVPDARLAELREMPDMTTLPLQFISHDRKGLDSSYVARARALSLPVLCWTVRTPDEEQAARIFARNITFERYRA